MWLTASGPNQAVKEKEGGGGVDEMELYGAGPPPGYRDWDDSAF